MSNRLTDTGEDLWERGARSPYDDSRFVERRPSLAALAALLALSLFVAWLPALAEESKGTPKPQGWLGVTLDSDGRPSAQGGAASPAGVLVAGVVAESPAQHAGLRGRDRILAVDGKTVSSGSELINLVKESAPGGWVTLSVQRGTRTMELRAFLETRPNNPGAMRILEGWIGAEAIDLPQDLRAHFGAPREAGVMISRVVAGSPAELAGLSLGDVVFEVDGEPIRSSRSFAGMVARGGVENRLQVRLMRDGAEITIEPVVAVRPEKETRGDRE